MMAGKKFGVLIVDDEEIVRNGISNIIDWDATGCSIIGEAGNGEEALEKIISLKPSLVLLDVNMPVLNGISVLEEVYKNPEKYPSHPYFLILSGYSDFEFAQKAINFGAKGYIVKPIDEDILQQKVISIVEELKHNSEADFLRNNAQQEEIAQKFSQMFLFGAVEDGFSAQEEDESCRYQVSIISPELCGCLGQLQALKTAIEDSFKFTQHFAFPMEPNYTIVFKNESDEAVQRHMERFCSRLQKEKSGALASLGKMGNGLNGALDSYRQARLIFNQLFFYADKAYVTTNDVEKDPEFAKRNSKKDKNYSSKEFLSCIPELVQYIEIYELQKISQVLNKQRTYLTESTLSVDEIKKYCMAFIVELQNAVHTKHPEKELDTVPAIDLVNLIYTQNYFDEMFCIVEDFTTGLAESFTSNTSNSTILKVIQYVKTNYHTDLKLEMLGNLFNCNSAYLGKKFREYTGVPFNTYLDIIRIEQAKNMLLTTNLKIYEISKLVGYSNTDYFYLKFKKHTNMTPKEFKSSQNA